MLCGGDFVSPREGLGAASSSSVSASSSGSSEIMGVENALHQKESWNSLKRENVRLSAGQFRRGRLKTPYPSLVNKPLTGGDFLPACGGRPVRLRRPGGKCVILTRV